MSEPVPNSLRTIAIIGGGLAGSYAAVVLAKRGYLVKVFERRADSRTQPASWEGRSINLALSERGRHALRLIGLEDRIVEQCVPMHGRYVVWVVRVILLHFVHFRSILKSLTNNPIQSINRLVE
jgi:2-polyprenyl-6-methoxyphenol hydroxylase-like FAD-dependent oxidoreductase